jgi:hypothetical protein
MRIRALPSLLSASSIRTVGLGAVALLVAGCVGAGAASPEDSGSPSASPDPIGSSSPAAAGFYLRAWRTQALAPWNTFGWLSSATISAGQFVDGNVVVPAIYPGATYLQLSFRPINGEGIQAIVDEARKDGLLTSQTTYGQGMPGGSVAHIRLVVDGVTYEMAGPLPGEPAAASPQPGTAAAFADFWNKITSVAMWLAADLGESVPYSPTQLAVLIGPPPAEGADSAIKPTVRDWPLASKFATFGTAMGTQYRCGVVAGDDLATLLPVVKAANQLTILVDSSGSKASIQARALMPGEPSPCA